MKFAKVKSPKNSQSDKFALLKLVLLASTLAKSAENKSALVKLALDNMASVKSTPGSLESVRSAF